MGNNKIKKYLVFGLLLLGIGLVVFAIFTYKPKSKEAITSTVIDSDTGDTIVTDKNVTPETFGGSEITLLGGSSLYNIMSSDQFVLVRQSINDYVHDNISAEAKTAKILPESVKTQFDGERILATLKVEEPLTSVQITIDLHQGRAVRIKYERSGAAPVDTGWLPDATGGSPPKKVIPD